MSILAAVAVLAGLGALLGGVLLLAGQRLRSHGHEAVDAVYALLPRTQCAQCGYAGCRPFAEALVAGRARVDQCPPGGDATMQRLARLLGREPVPLAGPSTPLSAAPVAKIDESLCIGCARCSEACPVDAIVGAHQYMHTVIADECTGCELCLPPCPVDCISLVPGAAPPPPEIPATARKQLRAPAPRRSRMRSAWSLLAAQGGWRRRRAARGPAQPCIRCGACAETCPAGLMPQLLHFEALRKGHDALQSLRLGDCIECGRCDLVCPSHIPLTREFRTAKREIHTASHEAARAQHADRRHGARQHRLTRRAEERQAALAQRKAEAVTGAGESIAAILARVRNRKGHGR